MKPETLTCPHARYDGELRIACAKAGCLCGNQFFKRCTGWWALNANAGRCPLREDEHGTK